MALTVRSIMPSSIAISRFEQPETSSLRTSRSRSLIFVSLLGVTRRSDKVARSMNFAKTRLGIHTEPACTSRIAFLNSSAVASSGRYPLAPAKIARKMSSSRFLAPSR